MTKNPHAVALGQRTSTRKAQTSKQNGTLGGRPPGGVDRELWRAVVAKATADGLTIRQVYERLFRAFLS